MATSPSDTRAALTIVAGEAANEVRQIGQAAIESPVATRAALFAAVPLVIEEYATGSAALALDWFEEIREEAAPRNVFVPRLVVNTIEDELNAAIAQATRSLYEIERNLRDDLEEATAEAMRSIEAMVTREVADSFRETVTENAAEDPDAVGWRRFARTEACKFCLMLAARGAVYTRETARFAAHGADMGNGRKGGNCMCIAGPAYATEGDWTEATPLQYMASQRRRTAKQRAALRDYLNANFPDAPG